MISCDLCGSADPQRILESPRLDGPLVRCRKCGLYYVGERRSELVFGSGTSAEVVERVRDANRDLRNLPIDEEHRLAELNAKARLQMIRQYRPSGKLLEVGCARGDFLRIAREYFTSFGVEPNPELAEEAIKIAPVHQGLIETEPGSYYDVAASFHVIEHTPSPKNFLAAIAQRLRPRGLIVLETPDIDSVPFRILKSRWRQFIPEHYYFFDESTMTKLLQDGGFKVEKIARVGKYASGALMLNRLSRYFSPLQHFEGLATRLHLSRLTFEMNPYDIMIAIATKKED
jgi:2-polyprenyl-3-methyl-5-hydroxy-6-metoxy-1,4-benzoquinol methylase